MPPICHPNSEKTSLNTRKALNPLNYCQIQCFFRSLCSCYDVFTCVTCSNRSTERSTIFSVSCTYVCKVVSMLVCPNRVCTSFTSAPFSISSVAWVCPYGIITTNRKSSVYQGFSVIWQGFSSFSEPKNRAAK